MAPGVSVESNSGLPRRAEAVSSTNFVFPNDTNHHGTMFGGRVLQLMDQTGAIAAARFAHTTVVTAAMEAVSFQHPIREGMIIETVARVVYTGRTSMIVRVDVFADHQLTGERKRATTGYLTMVALDAAGKPTPVPRLLIETEDERADEEAAEHVRHAAKQRVGSSRFEVRGSEFEARRILLRTSNLEPRTSKEVWMILTGMGSYPRVGDTGELQRLRRGIHRFDRKEIDRDDLNAIADDVTAEVIREQVQAGLDWVTDGCIRWEDMVSHVANKLPGVHRGGLLRYFDSNTYVRQPVVTGPVGWERPVVAADAAFAVGESPKPVKAVVTGPYTVAKYCDDQHYGALEPLVMDLATALNNEVKAIVATGVTCVQIDEPSILQEPGDWALFERAIVRLMEGVPGTTAIATYFGDAVPLVSQLLGLPFTIAYFDCSYAPLVVDALRGKAEGRHIGISVVDARNTKLESLEDVRGNIEMAQDVVGSHSLHITPSAGLEFLPRNRAYEKLERMVAGATVVSGK